MNVRSVLAASFLVLVVGCSGGSGPSSGRTTPSDPATGTASPEATPLPDRAAYATARVRTGSAPCGILGAADRVWVSNYNDGTLVSIDPGTLAVSRPVTIGSHPCGLAFGAGSVWTENFGSFDVTRVSVTTGKVQATYDVGYSPYDVTFADGAAWVTNNGSASVSRIDAASGDVTRIRTGGAPVGIAPAAGKVWVGLGAKGIVAIDTATSRVTDRIATDGAAGWTAYDGDRVWVDVDATVVEVDARTATVVRTVPVGEQPEDGAVVGHDVWVGDRSGMLRVFAVDGGPVREVPSTVANPFVLTEHDGQAWVVDFAGSHVVRIDPRSVP